jgi:hypothetical protein
MTLARLLAAALLLFSLSALAQNQRAQNCRHCLGRCTAPSSTGCISQSTFVAGSFLDPRRATTPAEPWRIIPNGTPTLTSGQTRLDQTPVDQLKLEVRVRQLESQLDRLSGEGPTCYAIRSYMVARDSKDSDSTHPAGYSTCQPVGRYGVKTITSGPEPADH